MQLPFARSPWRDRTQMKHYFEFASRSSVLMSTMIGVLSFVFIVFPSLPIGGDMLDISAGYSYQELVRAMEQYGASGRRVYAWASPTVDTLFPMLYVSFFAGVLYRFRPTDAWGRLAWIPVFAGAWDLCENAQITALLLMYPAISETQVASASFFTHVKTVFIAPAYQLPSIAFVVVAALRWLAHRFGGR